MNDVIALAKDSFPLLYKRTIDAYGHLTDAEETYLERSLTVWMHVENHLSDTVPDFAADFGGGSSEELPYDAALDGEGLARDPLATTIIRELMSFQATAKSLVERAPDTSEESIRKAAKDLTRTPNRMWPHPAIVLAAMGKPYWTET